jgi:hypothetical protein
VFGISAVYVLGCKVIASSVFVTWTGVVLTWARVRPSGSPLASALGSRRRLTHELGATQLVRVDRPVPLSALHATEAALDELDTLAGEHALDVTP